MDSSRMDSSRLAIIQTIAIILCTLGLVGCKKDQIRVYQVEKEKPREMAHPDDGHDHSAHQQPGAPTMRSPHGSHQAEQAIPLTWTAPEGWQKVESHGIRLASFLIPNDNGAKGDVSLFTFMGQNPNLSSYVNIWRNELKLPEIKEEQLPQMTAEAKTGFGPAAIIDIAGLEADEPADNQRILAGVFIYAQRIWFVKLSGPAPLVEDQRDELLSFIASIRPEEERQ